MPSGITYVFSPNTRIQSAQVNQDFTDAVNVVLDYKEVTADQGGITSPAGADLTGLASTVTVPAGGRYIRITGHGLANNTSATGNFIVAINEGATQKQFTRIAIPDTTYSFGFIVQVILAPTAGSHSYKLVANVNSGTGTLTANAVYPAFLLIESL